MNPVDVVGASQRTVLTGRDDSGAETATVVVERRYPYAIDELWDAVTNPERLPRWFAPVSGDLHEGGRYAIEGNASGTITTCTPPEKLELTWEFGGGISWVTAVLTAVGEQTDLRVEHLAEVTDHWRMYGAGAGGVGWDLFLYGLDEYLRTDEAVAQREQGPEIADFIRESGRAWCVAEVASGESEAAAQERRDKTIAFYTGG